MDYLNLFLAPTSWPSGVWETIVKWFSAVGNFGLAIILLTLAIKILMLPLDLWQKSVGRKMSLQQAKMQPEMEKLRQKYKDPNVLQQKQAELYKKYNVSPAGSCGGMLVYMLVTLTVFITLFNALGNISRVQINYEYYQLRTEYVASYQANLESQDIGEYATVEEYATAMSQKAVADKFETVRNGFLSIKNIWRPDNGSSVFPTANEFISTTGTKFYIETNEESDFYGFVMISTDTSTPYIDINGNVYSSQTEQINSTIKIGDVDYNIVYGDQSLVTDKKDIKAVTLEKAQSVFKEDFAVVTAGINQKYDGVWNGYLVLIILAGVVTFLSQYLSTIGVKGKDDKGNTIKGAKSQWIMGLVLAGVMIMFTINYTSMFALYIVTNSILSIIFNILINLILNKVQPKVEEKKKGTVVADYVRID